jgi:hypothetical protein
MRKEDLIEYSLIHPSDNKFHMDDETRREFWQKKVTKTHLKLISLAFESNLAIYPNGTHVTMLSDAGVHWCNLVRGVITGKFDDHISYEVKK